MTVLKTMLAFTFVLVAGCGSSVVGAECAPGYESCDGECVWISDDPAHCGGCNNVCAGGTCVDGRCTGEGGVDMGVTDMRVTDGSVDMATTDMTPVDFGPRPECACNLGERCCDGLCVGTDIEPTDCGACGNECPAGEVCSSGTCAPVCEDGLTLCAGRCIDLTSNPNHCGSCGNVCESGICADGSCAVGFPGHVILIGHNYRMNREGQNRVAGNAVLTSFASSPEVVAYRGASTNSWVRGVDRAIDQVASARGASWNKREVAAADVPFELADADVFLVYPQADGPTDDELRTIAGTWSVALDTFTRRSGVVIVFDGGGSHGGTWQMLAAAGLLDASGRSDVSGDELTLSDPADSVAFGVPIRYVGEVDTVRFEEAGSADAVVSHPDGPVVLHRTILP